MKLLWLSVQACSVSTSSLGMSFQLPISDNACANSPLSYINVYKVKAESGQARFTPLLHLLSFPVTAALQVFWLSSPSFSRSFIINSPLFVPFLCAWGLQFAHQVGRMILAHVTKQPFPWFDAMWIWSLVGAIDANLLRLIGRYVT